VIGSGRRHLVVGNRGDLGGPDDPGREGRQFRTLGDDVGQHHGDVVGGPGGVGAGDQLGEGAVEVLFAQDPLDLRIRDESAQPVGAEQQPVAELEIHQLGVGGVLGLAVEHLEQQRAVRVDRRLLLGDPALVDQRLHPGVVVGHPGEPVGAHQVAAGVADVDQAELGAVEHRPAEGGAHALQGAVPGDQVGQLVVGGRDRPGEQGEHLLAPGGGSRPGPPA
jgi:hypothetical protein